MVGIAKRNPQFVGDNRVVPEDQKHRYKVTMMKIFRNLKCCTRTEDIEFNLNALRLSLQCETFDFNYPRQDMQWTTVMDLAPAEDSKYDAELVCYIACV